MSKPPELPSETAGTDADFNPDADADPAFARTPVRFGRLALWVASASALTVGILGTVAYGVWFNQDQHAYAEAMEHARQTLWLAAAPQPTPVVQPTSASGEVTAEVTAQVGPPVIPPPRPVTVASADLNAPVPVPSTQATQADHRADSSDSSTPKLAVTRPVRASCPTSTTHRRPVTRVKSTGNVFTRMGSFFHRVSYRQHGTQSQQDIYAHP